ncbi:hypothetical protein [Nostoc sp.]|uniref:hypothetical protein n=1 Tax=Nostoc sp. TaxID=1180 RepID=UPI002FF5031A
MGNEVELLEHWRQLTPQKQQKVLEFVELLKSEPETTPAESEFCATNTLSQKIMVDPTTSDRCWIATS